MQLASHAAFHAAPRACAARSVVVFLLLVPLLLGGCGTSRETVEAPAAVESGEPYTVGHTVRLGTLIGYGMNMTAAEAPPNVQSVEAGGDVVWGTDEGFITTLSVDGEERIYFFFGDTTARTSGANAFRTFEIAKGIEAGDIIGYTTDGDPEDGVQLDHVLRNNEGGGRVCVRTADDGYRSIYIPDVNHTCTGNDAGVEVPTGVIALPERYGSPPRLVMFFGKAGDLNDTSGSTTYVAVSNNLGYDWSPLRDGDGTPVVFSQGAAGHPAKFLVVNPILVDAAAFQGPASAPCQLPLPEGPEGMDTHGLLLFSSGQYRRSDIYLAFLPIASLLQALEHPGQVDLHDAVSYFAGIGAAAGPGGCWSRQQADALPIVRTADASEYVRLESPCGNELLEGSTGAGEFSVTHVRTGDVDRLVLLLNNGYALADGRYGSPGPQLVTGDPRRPWIWNTRTPFAQLDGTEVQDTRPYVPLTIPRPASGDDVPGFGTVCPSQWTPDTALWGYGPMLINPYTRPSASGRGVDLYFILSRWKGTVDFRNGPYRVDVFRTTLTPAG